MGLTVMTVGLVVGLAALLFALACCSAAGRADAVHEETRRRQALGRGGQA